MLDSRSGLMASILVVCTGNVCRSPLAEGFLRNAMERRFGDDAPFVASAGIAGWEGSPAIEESVQAAAERDVDISDHVARRLVRGHIEAADLVLAMAREHGEAVIGTVPQAGSRTFTLKELVRLLDELSAADARAATPAELLIGRVGAADALRRSGFSGNPHDEDVVDPLGLPLDSFRAVAWELADWCARLADGLFGKAPARAGMRDEDE